MAPVGLSRRPPPAELDPVSRNFALIPGVQSANRRKQRTAAAEVTAVNATERRSRNRAAHILDVSRDETGLLLDLDNLPRRIRRRKPRPG